MELGKLLDDVLTFRLALTSVQIDASGTDPDFSKCADIDWLSSPSASDSRVSSMCKGMDETAKKSAKVKLCSTPDSATLDIFETWGSDALKVYAKTMREDIAHRSEAKAKPVLASKRGREEEGAVAAASAAPVEVNAFARMKEASAGYGSGGGGGGGGKVGKSALAAETVEAVKAKIGAQSAKKPKVDNGPPAPPPPAQPPAGIVERARAVAGAVAGALFGKG